jgi:hypothetical protein
MPDGDDKTGQAGAGSGDGNQDVTYWQNEAKQAFKVRDELKSKLRSLEGRALSEAEVTEYRDLKQRWADLEEDRNKKAGEFEKAKASLVEKFTGEIKARDEKLTTLERQVADEKIGAAFAAAGELFGPTGETILPPDVAASYFRDRVAYADVEIAGKTIRTVVVHDATGNIVQGGDGNPLPFADALRAVIKALPTGTQDRILRGSGKVGSGSSGSAGIPASDSDLDALLVRVKAGDKEAIATLRQRQASRGGMVVGSVWDQK